MLLMTKYHGSIEYNKDEVITFEKGLPGFVNLKKFIIFPVEHNDLFKVIHSIEDSKIGFVIISPFSVDEKYEFKLSDKQIELLRITNEDQVQVYNIVTLNSDLKKITVNMRAPLVINSDEKLGEQVILNNERYKVKYPLFKEE